MYPEKSRVDAETENAIIKRFQIAFRSIHTDKDAGDRSVGVGQSVRNQVRMRVQ